MYLDTTSPLGDSTASTQQAASLITLAAALADRSPSPGGPALAHDLAAVLRRLHDQVPGAAAASLLAASPAVRGDGGVAPASIAATSELAQAADECQLSAGTGPSLDARVRAVHVTADELVHRWPDVGEPLRQLGITELLAAPLPGLAGRGALTFYADARFPADALAPAAEAAAVAAVALTGLETRERAANLEIALASSRQIAAAVGIVMAQDRCSYEEAFQLIRSISQRTHRKMRELAEQIVFTGARPEGGGGRAATG